MQHLYLGLAALSAPTSSCHNAQLPTINHPHQLESLTPLAIFFHPIALEAYAYSASSYTLGRPIFPMPPLIHIYILFLPALTFRLGVLDEFQHY